jgi:hypothetical protein
MNCKNGKEARNKTKKNRHELKRELRHKKAIKEKRHE